MDQFHVGLSEFLRFKARWLQAKCWASERYLGDLVTEAGWKVTQFFDAQNRLSGVGPTKYSDSDVECVGYRQDRRYSERSTETRDGQSGSVSAIGGSWPRPSLGIQGIASRLVRRGGFAPLGVRVQ
jgi:hypothetical protein